MWASDPVWKFLLKCKLLFLWQDFSVLCSWPVYAGFICDTEKQYILDLHNNLRKRVAKGLETTGNPGPQPPAANMRKLVSKISLAVHKLLIACISNNCLQYGVYLKNVHFIRESANWLFGWWTDGKLVISQQCTFFVFQLETLFLGTLNKPLFIGVGRRTGKNSTAVDRPVRLYNPHRV